ncbi:hypothetical protein M427DRAFT_35904 [Gonapodya prolifera JEL478]|uniref:Uncharacterized protein n=1 Tax=Gonapodya prolifera (strain JEL478) TaxID=1344416 RepID=A0A139A448_GONPJ|nr:hypothetical protein M427DRAFT_35904 [Gonapodya prolifera JEL478]|eukprot:KXS11368.1 hypothetical protein M427DRAFT_35904 [Gonapodya prolifera JEL478]
MVPTPVNQPAPVDGAGEAQKFAEKWITICSDIRLQWDLFDAVRSAIQHHITNARVPKLINELATLKAEAPLKISGLEVQLAKVQADKALLGAQFAKLHIREHEQQQDLTARVAQMQSDLTRRVEEAERFRAEKIISDAAEERRKTAVAELEKRLDELKSEYMSEETKLEERLDALQQKVQVTGTVGGQWAIPIVISFWWW